MEIGGIAGNTVIFYSEPAGSGRPEADGDGIEKRHAAAYEEQDFQQGHTKIDQIQDPGSGFDLWHQLSHRWSRALGAHQVHIRTAAHGDDGENEDENPHTADPVCEAAPEDGAVAQRLYITQYACPGSSETGDGFE